jgi:lysozyme family protein
MTEMEDRQFPDPVADQNESAVFESLLAEELPAPDFQKLQDEYYRQWAQMNIDPAKLTEIDSDLEQIVRHQAQYDSVSVATGVPWYVIAVIHCLEGSLNFETHLHNGDPLTARTIDDPKGRPPTGTPPFSWEESAIDALRFDNIAGNHEWSIAGIAYLLEGYNGWGYRIFHPDVNTPYLWSFSDLYRSGKYIQDGRFSQTAVSDQCGGYCSAQEDGKSGINRLTGYRHIKALICPKYR